MSSDDETAPDDEVGCGSNIEFTWEKLPRAKVQVKAHLGGVMFHCDAYKLDDARERTRFRNQVAARAGGRYDLEVDADDLEPALLAILDEIAGQAEDVAVAPVDYQVVEGRGPARSGRDLRPQAVRPGPARQLHRPYRPGHHGQRWRRVATHVRGAGHPPRRRVGASASTPRISRTATSSPPRSSPPPDAKVQILCRPEVLGRAISAISAPTRRVMTTDFGWTGAADAYLTPSVRIDADGIHPTGRRRRGPRRPRRRAMRQPPRPRGARGGRTRRTQAARDRRPARPPRSPRHVLAARGGRPGRAVPLRRGDESPRHLAGRHHRRGQVVHRQALPELLRRLPDRDGIGGRELVLDRQFPPEAGIFLPGAPRS